MQELQIFIFYLLIIVVTSSATYKISSSSTKTVNSMYGAIVGAIVSLILWHKIGKYSVTN